MKLAGKFFLTREAVVAAKPRLQGVVMFPEKGGFRVADGPFPLGSKAADASLAETQTGNHRAELFV